MGGVSDLFFIFAPDMIQIGPIGSSVLRLIHEVLKLTLSMGRKSLYSGKIFVWFCVGVCGMVFSACTSEKTEFNDPAGGDRLQLTFTRAATRADVSQDGSGDFTDGDRIGLYVDNGTDVSYRQLTLTGGQWLPVLKRSEFGSGTLHLSAWYAGGNELSAGQTEGVPFRLSGDQSGAGYAASDLLFSRVTLDAGVSRGNFTFVHALHRVRVTLSDNAEGTVISVRSRLDGTLDLLSGEARVSDGDFGWITPRRNADGSFEAIVFPQPASPYRTDEGLLKISANGKESFFMAPEQLADGSDLVDFESGRQTTVRLSMKGESSDWAGKKCWVYGIKPPEDKEWMQLYPDLYGIYYLQWKPEYGWYDCNKRNPTASPDGVPDGMLCWAATASNLMHWWIAQNKEYIDLYGDRYKGPNYDYPLNKPQESDIFQCFIDSFYDKAGYGDAGVNWFLHGIEPSIPLLRSPKNAAGYFKDVFPGNVQLAKGTNGLSREVFTETIKDALSNKKGLGLTLGTVRSGHAVTMWGAEFNDEGFVSYIYVADNNDRDQYGPYNVGCLRLRIVYVTLPGSTTTTTHYSNDYVGSEDYTTPVSRLFTVSLGQEYWKEYLHL